MDSRPRLKPSESPSTNCMNPPMHTSRPWVSSTNLAWLGSPPLGSHCISTIHKPILGMNPKQKQQETSGTKNRSPLSFPIISPCIQRHVFVRHCLGFPSCEGLNLTLPQQQQQQSDRAGGTASTSQPIGRSMNEWLKEKNTLLTKLFFFRQTSRGRRQVQRTGDRDVWYQHVRPELYPSWRFILQRRPSPNGRCSPEYWCSTRRTGKTQFLSICPLSHPTQTTMLFPESLTRARSFVSCQVLCAFVCAFVFWPSLLSLWRCWGISLSRIRREKENEWKKCLLLGDRRTVDSNSNKETFSCMPRQERMMVHNANRLTCFSFSLLAFIVTLLTPGGQISRLGSSYIECLERAQAQMKEYQVCFLCSLLFYRTIENQMRSCRSHPCPFC